MATLIGQLGSMLTTPPGSLIYQLVLAFSVAASLQAAFARQRATGAVRDRRTKLGLGAMLAALAVLVAAGIATLGGNAIAGMALPALDRAVTFVLVTWSLWLWACPEPSKRLDLGAPVLSAIALAAGVLSAIPGAAGDIPSGYNQTTNNALWQLATLGLLGLGGILLYIRRPEGFVNGLVFAAVVLLGHILHLVVREAGDYSGIVRVAHMAAFPLLLTLPQRWVALPTEKAAAGRAGETRPSESRRYGADPKTVHALLGLAGETDRARLDQAMARAVSRTMLADLCFVAYPMEGAGHLSISSGYDLIREEYLRGTLVDNASVPRLANSIQRGKSLRLLADGISGDVRSLGDRLGLRKPGNLLSAPIGTAENEVLGALLLLSAYSERQWSSEDQTLLVSIASALAPVIRRARDVEQRGSERDGLSEALRANKAEIQLLQRRNDDLARHLETLALESEKSAAETAEAAMLRASRDRADVRIRELEAALGSIRGPAGFAGSRSADQLQTSLLRQAPLHDQPTAGPTQEAPGREIEAGGAARSQERAENIAAASRELRQSASSASGYVDLLLGESVGILGVLQRKFIERIKASIERIGSLISEIVQLNASEERSSRLKPGAMDLNVIVDEALAYTSSRLREKKIAVHLDLPPHVAAGGVDRGALRQILIQLLQNAGAASPMEGTVALKVVPTVDEGRPHLMIKVQDSGGGIPEEELPQVFARRSPEDDSVLQGTGDTGAGLFIAKTLTEGQGGRMWVENRPGAGVTFCVLFPEAKESVALPSDGESS